MNKILIEGNKVIIDGHANDLETCNTLTNLCDELSTSEKFRTVKYESGYGEFESVSESEGKKFKPDEGTVKIYIKSNDGSSLLYEGHYNDNGLTITPTGVSWDSNGQNHEYIYTGSKVFLGLSNTPNATIAKYTYGTVSVDEYVSGSDLLLYIVEADPGYQVNIQSNDGTTTLSQNATVDSVVVTSTGAQLKYRDAVNATYTYSGSKLFAGLATSANAIIPKYKPGDTIKITGETTLYIVENIIIPEHHSSLNELFTNIATVIREKTGETGTIAAAQIPSVIRSSLQAIPAPVSLIITGSTNKEYGRVTVKDVGDYYGETTLQIPIGTEISVYTNGTATDSGVYKNGEFVINGTYTFNIEKQTSIALSLSQVDQFPYMYMLSKAMITD